MEKDKIWGASRKSSSGAAMKSLFIDYLGWRIHESTEGYCAWDMRRGWGSLHLYGKTQMEIKKKIKMKRGRPKQNLVDKPS